MNASTPKHLGTTQIEVMELFSESTTQREKTLGPPAEAVLLKISCHTFYHLDFWEQASYPQARPLALPWSSANIPA
jgi:hypothetical protein